MKYLGKKKAKNDQNYLQGNGIQIEKILCRGGGRWNHLLAGWMTCRRILRRI